MAAINKEEFERKKAVVLCDSLGRNLRHIYKTDVQSYPGCTIDKLIDIVLAKKKELEKYQVIALIIGTNNISSVDIWKLFKQKQKIEKHDRFEVNLPIIPLKPQNLF